jgi:hypothetical protein
MAADTGVSLHNALVPTDVNGDFAISPIDALQVINALNRNSGGEGLGGASGEADSEEQVFVPMVDVNNDGSLSPIDALMVINRLRTGEGVGELAEVSAQVLNSTGGLLTPTVVGGVPEYTIGIGERFTLRTRTRDLRPDASGVFSTYLDVNYVTQGNASSELAQVLWGEYQTVRFGGLTNGGTFTLSYGAETTAPIQYTTNTGTMRTRIANAVGALSFVGGTANIRVDNFEIEGPTPRDQVYGISFINSFFRQNITDVAVGSNNLTTSNGSAAIIQVNSTADPANKDVLGAAITYPINQASGGNTFSYNAGRATGTLLSSAGGFKLDNVGNFTGSQPNLDDSSVFFSIFDTAFRAANSAGVVDFTVGSSGDNKLTVALFGSDTVVPDNLITFPSPFRIRFTSALQAVNDTFAVTENSTNNSLDVRANDTSSVGSFLVTAVTQPVSGGSVSIVNGGNAVAYTPTPSFSGTTQFTYTITAGSNTSTATVTVNVNPFNDSPIPQTLPSVAEDSGPTTFTPNTLFSPGPGEDAQTITLSNVALVPGQTGGTVVLQGGNVIFSPMPDFFGSVQFVATGTDNGTPPASTTATFTVNVTPVNDPPVVIQSSFSVNEDTSLTINAPQIFSPGPSNESSQTVTLLSAAAADGQTGGTIQVVNGNAVFTPTPNFHGPFLFVAVAQDNGSPAAQSQPATVTINVLPVNDPPIAVDDTGANRFVVLGVPGNSNLLDVMANDSPGPNEPNDIRITAVGNLQGPGSVRGTVSINADGSRVVYAPPSGLITATETFSYTITDGGGLTASATAEVFIIPPTFPFAVNDSAVAVESGSAVTIDVLANDFINDGFARQLLSFSSLTPSAAGTLALNDNGTPVGLVYTPAPDFNGSVTFTYTMSDTKEGSQPSTATVAITVSEVNTPPILVNQSVAGTEDTVLTITAAQALSGASPGVNEAEQTLTITGASVVTSGAGTVAVNASGNIVFTPAANFVGAAVIQFTATDNGTTNGVADPKSATASITVNVAAVNDPPIAVDDVFTLREDEALPIATSALTANDRPGPNTASDETSQSLTVVSVAMVNPAQGAIVLQGNNVIFTPAADFNGTALATYVIQDSGPGNPQATGTITFTVREVNDAPVPLNATRAAFANLPTVVNLSDELAQSSRGAVNEANQTLQVIRVIPLTGANPTRGTVALNQDGTITYTAPAGFEGVDVFDYEVIDNGTTEGVADPKRGMARVTVNVNPFAPSRIEGRVWIDDNNNGRHDIDELVLNDIEIKISGQPQGGNLRASEVIVETDALGRYSLEQLPPGQYTITMMRPEFMIDAPEVEVIAAAIGPAGGAALTANFRVLGINNVANTLWESQISTFYMRQGTAWGHRGFTALVSADGSPLWNIHRGGFEGTLSNEISLTNNGRDVVLRSVAPDDQGGLVEIQATVPRNRVYRTTVDGGNILLRVLALPDELNFEVVQIQSATPSITAEGFAYAADDIYSRDLWR